MLHQHQLSFFVLTTLLGACEGLLDGDDVGLVDGCNVQLCDKRGRHITLEYLTQNNNSSDYPDVSPSPIRYTIYAKNVTTLLTINNK